MAQAIQKTNSTKYEDLEQIGLSTGQLQIPKNKLTLAALGVLIFGILLIAIGAGVYLFKNSNSGDDIKIIEGSASAAVLSGELVVHIDGAVAQPGVYKLSSGSRVTDAVSAAGGLSTDADGSKVNLAAKVTDGQKLHIASVSESAQVAGSGQSAQTAISASATGLVNVNTASGAQLEALPAVGPATAAKIIASRPYNSLDDLVSKKAVSKSTFEKIKELISY